MKKVVIILICLFSLLGCTKKEEKTYQIITSKEAYEIIETEEDIIILDVRSESEYNESHIKNAINLPLDKIEGNFKSEVTEDLNKKILVYCKSGARSKSASEILSNLGYKNVYNFGGLNNWEYELVE